MNKAKYRPARGKLLATIVQGGKFVCIFKVPPTDAQGHAMAEGLNAALTEPSAVPKHNKTE